ncbi:MAG TPA: CBS domain-containing protein [Firmicutes bacterium]|nr:CBS domain-containing protein [Bacillota bacterium]
MLVRDYMSLNPITVGPQDSVGYALQLMKEHSIRRLPVVSKGQIVGIVTRQDLLRASPSSATSLSVWEINYLFPKVKISEVMTRQVITISPEAVLEKAALVMRENSVSALPVLENNRLVAIITESDIFKALIDIFAFDCPGVRLTLAVEDEVGVLHNITEIISSLGINIITLAARRLDSNRVNIMLRLQENDISSVSKLLAEKGYQVVRTNT